MFKKLLTFFPVLLIASSMAFHGQAVAELQEMGLISHLVTHSHTQLEQSQHSGADSDTDHEVDGDDDHDVNAHDHHRHSPDQPMHSHSHFNPGSYTTVVQISLEKSSSFLSLRLSPVLVLKMKGDDRIALHREISFVYRPPIC
ncbi:MAG: hypothetical protein H7222_00650 [Methylotenera sp.]|nr:hypothetical protein [Oligoflexia bacterium]